MVQNFLIKILSALAIVLGWILTPIFKILDLRRPKKIPVVKNANLLCTATELAHKIRNREISSLEVVVAYIERIKEVNPIINAIVDERFQNAIEEAKAVDKFIQDNQIDADSLKEAKPLLGVPLTVKESCAVKDLSFAVGCLKRHNVKASEDSGAVKNLKKAGAIVLLVSKTPEYCAGIETCNLLNGRTYNPYNTNRTTGGSSGGEGALLSSAASIIGIGSDFGGSIRLPSMFNGVFGHKPTPRLVPHDGHFPDSLDNVTYDFFSMGPMTRYAIDLKIVLKAMINNESDILDLNEKVELSSLRLYHMQNLGYSLGIHKLQKDISKKMKECIKFLALECGLTTFNKKFELFKMTPAICSSWFFQLKDRPRFLENPENPKEDLNFFMEVLRGPFGQNSIAFNILTLVFLEKSYRLLPYRSQKYHTEMLPQLRQELINELGTDGVLLCPSFPRTAFQHNQSIMMLPNVFYPMIFSILGFPVTCVPLGLDRKGLPIGIQVIAAPFQDKLCIAVAEALENKFGGWTPPYISRK